MLNDHINSNFTDQGKTKLLGAQAVERNEDAPAQSLATSIAAIVATIASVITGILIISYCSNTNTNESYLGGLNWGDLIFNYHPIFMTFGLIVAFSNALLTFRHLPFNKTVKKIVHGVLHSTAILFIIIGLSAVIIGNNFKSQNTSGVYFSNLFSLHSFVGLSAIAVYFQNYVFGIIFFGLDILSLDLRKYYKPNHVLLGIIALFLALAAVESGAMELFAELGCFYDVTSPDTNPAANYHLLPAGCRTLNAVGIFAILTVVATVVAVVDVKPYTQ